MAIYIDASCADTEQTVNEVLNKVLSVIEDSESKRKDTVRNKLKKDPELLKMFELLVERKAILCTTKKINGSNRSFLSVADRKLIYYAINKNVDVPDIEKLKEQFLYWYSIKNENLKGKLANYSYLKSDTEVVGFSKYMELPLRAFTLITDHCESVYKEHLRIINRTPCPNPFVDKYKNVIINETEIKSEKVDSEEKTEESDVKNLKEYNLDLQSYIDEIIRKNKEETEKLKKFNPYQLQSHLECIQKEIDDIIDNISVKIDALKVRSRCLKSLNKNDININILIAKLLVDSDDFEYISTYLKYIKNICSVANLLKKDITGNLSEEDKNIIISMCNSTNN